MKLGIEINAIRPTINLNTKLKSQLATYRLSQRATPFYPVTAPTRQEERASFGTLNQELLAAEMKQTLKTPQNKHVKRIFDVIA